MTIALADKRLTQEQGLKDGLRTTYIKTVRGETSKVDIHKDYVVKIQINFLKYDLIKNEREKLERLKDSPHFPRVLSSNGRELKLENVGNPLTKFNLPPNWERQFGKIIQSLKAAEVVHRDIRPQNFLVKDGVIRLIDFGWATFKGRRGPNPPGLGGRFKPEGRFDDVYSIIEVSKLYAHE